jgi:hypothetical protein
MSTERIITGIVFSKNRALQLDATLKSLFLHCLDAQILSLKVIYTGSSTMFLEQYELLKNEYPGVEFILQGDFRQDVFNSLSLPNSLWGRLALQLGFGYDFPNHYILFLVDDNIFIRDFQLKEALEALQNNEDAIGFSLQLGLNISYCYPLDIPLEFPAHQAVTERIIKYHWPDAGDGLNYPLEVSSSIYRLKNIAPLLASLNFSNPNLLEGQMAQKATTYHISHPYLLCYTHSVTFCNPTNKVQNVYANKAGNQPGNSADSLALLFDQGFRINTNLYLNFSPIACHQEIDMQFEHFKIQ